MGRDKGPAKGGKGAPAAAPATAPKAVQLSLRPDECPVCGHDVAVSEEQHVLGTCGACAGHPYHIGCVQEAWEKVQQKIKVRPCDMFATNGTSQRLPVNCPACKSGVMLAADMVKPVRKLTPAPPVALPRQPRSQQPAAAAPASKKGPITPPPSGSTYARQPAAAARSASLAGSKSGSGLARAGSGLASSGLASGTTRPDPIPSRPAWLRLCNSVLEDERCYVYNCPFCHSVEEQQEREGEYLQEQKEAARQRRAAELEQHRQQQAQQEREQRQAAAAEEAARVDAAAAAVQASLAAEERQAAMRRDLLAREEASLQLSADALALMKRHKRSACITSLIEMGYDTSNATAAAEAAGCEPAAAASMLLDGGLSGKVPSAVSIIREARELLAEGAKMGLSPTAVEAAAVAADGNWEQALWELQQSRRASQAPSTAGSTAAAPAFSAQAALSRQVSTASSSSTAVSSHLLPPSSGNTLGGSWAGVLLPPAAAPQDGLAASSRADLKDWGGSDPQLAGATSAWQQGNAQPAGAVSASFDEGFAAGMAAVQGVQQQPSAPAAAAVELPPAAPAEAKVEAEQSWAGGVPPPQERPPASDAEVEYLLSFLM